MKIKIDKLNINYIEYGKGKDILLLHGWGQNIEMMKPIGDNLSSKYHVVILDLPGFGESDEPKTAWNLEDYSVFLSKFIEKLKLTDITLIGHSFGGRIATIYASKNKINRLVLLSSPMIKKKNEHGLRVRILKFLNKVPILNKSSEFFKKRIGSTDYKNSSGIMREVLVNIVNMDLLKNAKDIKAPTIFIVGDDDRMISLEESHIIKDTIDDCGLIVYENKGHYAYLEELYRTVDIIKSFLN